MTGEQLPSDAEKKLRIEKYHNLLRSDGRLSAIMAAGYAAGFTRDQVDRDVAATDAEKLKRRGFRTAP